MPVAIVTGSFQSLIGGFDPNLLGPFDNDERCIVSVRDHFYVVDGLPRLTCLVTWVGRGRSPQSAGPSPTVDPPFAVAESSGPQRRSMDEQRVYDALRAWRRATARNKGMPSYVVFTNLQLATIAQRRPQSLAALREISGVGPSRAAEYGADILAIVQSAAPTPLPEGDPTPMPAGPSVEVRPPDEVAEGTC